MLCLGLSRVSGMEPQEMREKSIDPNPVSSQACKLAETELRWNELKKDLQKSPRAWVVPQSSYYYHNCEKLRQGRTVQNTNYNFYNYNINFSCNHEAGSVLAKNCEKIANLGGTFDQKNFSDFAAEVGRLNGCKSGTVSRDEKEKGKEQVKRPGVKNHTKEQRIHVTSLRGSIERNDRNEKSPFLS